MRRIYNSLRGFINPRTLLRKDEFREQIDEKSVFEQSVSLLPSYRGQDEHLRRTDERHSSTPFKTAIRKSTVPGANNGVFANQNISKGEVACLYPGIFCPRLPLWTVATTDGAICVPFMQFRLQYEENNYIAFLRNTSGYMDGNVAVERVDELMRSNPNAIGNVINHVPKWRSGPNVEPYDFLWRSALTLLEGQQERRVSVQQQGEELLAWLPNVMGSGPWFMEPSVGGTTAGDGKAGLIQGQQYTTHLLEDNFRTPEQILQVLPAMVFVAREDIAEGEELFFDYELEPRARPDWYE